MQRLADGREGHRGDKHIDKIEKKAQQVNQGHFISVGHGTPSGKEGHCKRSR
ncbi:hypothetical protein BN132_1542 [Cronobacter turicensis 564]|nr:hypothetical protein BN132_1542 [Cronobacter turicensis 564]